MEDHKKPFDLAMNVHGLEISLLRILRSRQDLTASFPNSFVSISVIMRRTSSRSRLTICSQWEGRTVTTTRNPSTWPGSRFAAAARSMA